MNDDDAYDRAFEILTQAVAAMGEEGVTKLQVVLPIADFVTAMALIVSGEDGGRALRDHVVRRIAEYQAGTFQQPNRH